MKKVAIFTFLAIPFLVLAEKPVEAKVEKKKVETVKIEKPITLPCPHCTYKTQSKNEFTRHLEKCPEGIISMTEKRLQSKDEKQKKEDHPENFFTTRAPKPPSEKVAPINGDKAPSSPQDRQIKAPSTNAIEQALRN